MFSSLSPKKKKNSPSSFLSCQAPPFALSSAETSLYSLSFTSPLWVGVRVGPILISYLDSVVEQNEKPSQPCIDRLLMKCASAPWLVSAVSPHHTFIALATLACWKANESVGGCPALYQLPRLSGDSPEPKTYPLDVYEDALVSHLDYLPEQTAVELSRYLEEQFLRNSVSKPKPPRSVRKAGGETETGEGGDGGGAGANSAGRGKAKPHVTGSGQESRERIWGV